MIPEDIKKNVRAVLLSKDGGIPMSSFLQDYKKLVLDTLNFRDLGFSSLKEFMEAIPDVARLDASQGKDSLRVRGVGEPDSYMPVSVRKAQGKLPKNYHKNLKNLSNSTKTSDEESLKNSSNSQINEEVPSKASSDPLQPEMQDPVDLENLELVPDHNGWYSAFMPKDKCPTLKKEEIQVIFSQAGDVTNSFVSERYVFVRFPSVEEVKNCVRMFTEYGMQIARNNIKGNEGLVKESVNNEKKGKQKRPDKKKKDCADESEAEYKTDTEANPAGRRGRQKPGRRKRDEQEHTGNHSSGLVNGHHNGDIINPEEVLLFVANLDSEESFRELIDPLKPARVRLVSKGGKIFGFVTARNRKQGELIITTLNHRIQSSGKPLLVDFDKAESDQQNKSSTSDMPPLVRNKSTISDIPPLVRVQSQKPQKQSSDKAGGRGMPSLELDYSDMPPLVRDTDLGRDVEIFDLDYPVFVANFPSASFESSIREIFKDFKVLDLCILNNNHERGCTKAYVYLPSIYEVARAVKTLHGTPSAEEPHLHIKVDVPKQNVVVHKVVEKMLQKDSARTNIQ